MTCRVWVPNMVTEQHPVTVMRPQMQEESFQYTATSYHPETRTRMVRVCNYVQQPRTVHVRRQTRLVRHLRHFAKLRQRPDRPAREVVRLLYAHQPRRGGVNAQREVLDPGLHLVGGESAADLAGRGVQDIQDTATDQPDSATLCADDVALALGDDGIARLRVRFDPDEVAHRPGGQEKRRFFTQQLGNPLAEGVDGGIFIALFIANRNQLFKIAATN